LRYTDAEQYEKAIEQFKLAISLKPELFPAHNNLGFVYAQVGGASRRSRLSKRQRGSRPPTPKPNTIWATLTLRWVSPKRH
jgi:tetratricopeptide (TPR) repeat protein